MATLAFERAGVISLAGQLADEADAAVRRAAATGRLDPVRRDRGVDLWAQARIVSWLGERALAEARAGEAGVTGSIIKLAWSQLSQRIGEFAADTAGPAALLSGPGSAGVLGGRSSTIAGGTTEVMKNILGERALGLPKEPSGSG
jgi:alkylation response protein AidB-like acyl-CoA dehydrogenase